MDDKTLFAGLTPAARAEMERRAAVRRFAEGDSLFRQGEPPREMFLLTAGRAKVWRATEAGGAFTLTVLGRGAALGTFGAGDAEEPWPMTATAMTTVEALAWRLDEVRRMMATDPALAATLLRIVTGHAAGMVIRLEEVAAVPVEQRLARILLRAELGGEPEDGGADDLPLSRQELADLVFSTLPTVSRIMSRWRAAGLVDGGRGRVKLIDRPGLALVAEG